MKYEPSIVKAFFRECGLPPMEFEYRFHETRKWRLDIAWVPEKVAVEVQGGIWIGGRHTRGAALLKEWEKLNNLAILGWRVLYTQPSDLMTEDFAAMVKMAVTRYTPTLSATAIPFQRI